MNWEKWVLVAAMALSTLVCVANIGKPRQPISSEQAAVIMLLNAFFVYLVVRA